MGGAAAVSDSLTTGGLSDLPDGSRPRSDGGSGNLPDGGSGNVRVVGGAAANEEVVVTEPTSPSVMDVNMSTLAPTPPPPPAVAALVVVPDESAESFRRLVVADEDCCCDDANKSGNTAGSYDRRDTLAKFLTCRGSST